MRYEEALGLTRQGDMWYRGDVPYVGADLFNPEENIEQAIDLLNSMRHWRIEKHGEANFEVTLFDRNRVVEARGTDLAKTICEAVRKW